VEADSGRASVTVPIVDDIPMRAYEIAFATAFRVAAWMMTRTPDAQGRDVLFDVLERDAIAPLRRFAPVGKSTLPLLRAAHRRGIPFRTLAGGIHQLGLGAMGRLVDRSTTARDSAIGRKLALDKALAAEAMRRAGLPAPVHERAGSLAQARAAAGRLGWPVVVKPPALDRGEGVSVDVDAAGLEQAFATALRLSATKQVLVERQVGGICHRLFLMSGRLLYAVKRLPLGVRGDGARSVAALVAAEREAQCRLPPWWRDPHLRAIDDAARVALAAAGLDEASVPATGAFVALRRIESTAAGGVDEDVTDHVDPETLRVARAAAELFGLDVAGIDIVSPDISVPWHRNGAVITEVNFAPLLGGGEISRRHLPAYLDLLLEGGDGLIPIDVVIGGAAAWDTALAHRRARSRDGAGIFVTSAERTLGGDGREIPMALRGLHARCRALLLSRQVHGLMILVQDDELLDAGLPVERIDTLIDAGGALRRWRDPGLTLDPATEARLRAYLVDLLPARALRWPEAGDPGGR
jgi:D-alanine-D-alanine ligase-like ATP-grasp enzyme